MGGALALLAGVMALGLLGAWTYGSGVAQRAEIAGRNAPSVQVSRTARLSALTDRVLRRTARGRDLAVRLSSAGLDTPPATFVGIMAAAAVGTYVVTSVILPPVLGLMLAFAAVAGCLGWLERKRSQRRFEFVAQLPDIARLLSNGTSAGLSMVGAVEMAAREIDDPARAELALVVEEIRLGRPLDEALEGLQRRLPSREVGVLLSTLVIQQRAGGDLVSALQDLADTLEARKDTLREVRTLMAGAVFTSWLVGAMGAGTLVLLNLIKPGTLDKMTTSLVGIVALAVAGAMYLVGFLIIVRTTRIEV